ncbi:hypothetical protein Cfor_00178 [Coptotermes formosanus]|jgi:hypothetical protein|uniref:Uncharacterized protein n=1 Tax=Coptotermes formosanus TaxID=36987 RepID=A0A6L2PJN8_COPFO|nr:hypothetical protein Cfor_00178 [Coptotermes formosanus]
MQAVYGGDCLDVRVVRRWAKKGWAGEQGKADLCDKQRRGRPLTATDEFHKKMVDEMIKNERITQRETAVKLGISQERAGCIIDVLQFGRSVQDGFLAC